MKQIKLEMQDGVRNKHEAGKKKKNQSKGSEAQASDQLSRHFTGVENGIAHKVRN